MQIITKKRAGVSILIADEIEFKFKSLKEAKRTFCSNGNFNTVRRAQL